VSYNSASRFVREPRLAWPSSVFAKSSLLFQTGHCQGMRKRLQFASDAKPRRSKNYWVEMLKTPPVCSARDFRSPGRILPLSEDRHHFSRTSPAPSYSCNSTTAPQMLSRHSRVITRFLRANISLHFPPTETTVVQKRNRQPFSRSKKAHAQNPCWRAHSRQIRSRTSFRIVCPVCDIERDSYIRICQVPHARETIGLPVRRESSSVTQRNERNTTSIDRNEIKSQRTDPKINACRQ